MKTVGKVSVILGGYVAAFALACCAIYLRQLGTSGVDAQASSGMYAFGDFMLFIAVFTLLSLAPTGFALYLLREVQAFWIALAVLALVIAITGPIGIFLNALTLHHVPLPHPVQLAGDLGFLRAIGAPLLVICFLTCAALAPPKFPRRALLVSTGLECIASSYFIVHLWLARAV